MFETPGDCDLTANVDFAYLKEAIQGAGMSFINYFWSIIILTGYLFDIL